MNYEINVSVFPPAGAGILQVPDGKGGFTILPAPAVEYKNVNNLRFKSGAPGESIARGGGISFNLRDGDLVNTNLPYIVRWVKKSDNES